MFLSGWAGAVWSGDTKSTWEDFNQQFRAGLNMVMSGEPRGPSHCCRPAPTPGAERLLCKTGIPYWTTDIGGFGSGDTTSADFRELVVRWFQWGAFCPLFRLHGARSGPPWPPGPAGKCGQSASNEIWMFGDESYAAIVKVMQMREKIRPYVMEQYRAAAADGTPVMRPLFYDFHNDTKAQTVDDQQMYVQLALLWLCFGCVSLCNRRQSSCMSARAEAAPRWIADGLPARAQVRAGLPRRPRAAEGRRLPRGLPATAPGRQRLEERLHRSRDGDGERRQDHHGEDAAGQLPAVQAPGEGGAARAAIDGQAGVALPLAACRTHPPPMR